MARRGRSCWRALWRLALLPATYVISFLFGAGGPYFLAALIGSDLVRWLKVEQRRPLVAGYWHGVGWPALATLTFAFCVSFSVGIALIVIACMWVYGWTSLRGPYVRRLRWYRAFAPFTCAATVFLLLPLREDPLEQHVGPLDYPEMPMAELRVRLADEHKIWWMGGNEQLRLRLSIQSPLSRRGILERIAAQAGCRVSISRCGTCEASGSFMVRRYPAFVRFDPLEGSTTVRR